MQGHRVSVLIVAALAVSAAVYGQSAQPAPPSKTLPSFRVSNVKELLASIGSDRTVILAKGDYVLSAGYGYTSAFVSWNDYDDGKELAITGAANLTIRGMDGARIVSDSATAYVLGIYHGRNVTIDDLAFVRRGPEGTEVEGGTIYVESTKGFFVDRTDLSGPATNALELSGVRNVRITRTSIQGSSSSAVSATSCDDIEMSSCTVAKNEGYPLFYFENSDHVALKKDKVQDNEGEDLIEIYADSGSVESIAFSDCDFERDKVDYFSGTELLPSTTSCTYVDSNFDEDWAKSSVAAASDEDYSDSDTETATYDHLASGLSFEYPQDWELQENKDSGRVGLFSPDGETVLLFATACPLPAGVDQGAADPKVFAGGEAALATLLKDSVGVESKLSPTAQPFDAGGFEAQDFGGSATTADGGSAVLRVRLCLAKGAVRAMIAMAKDGASLGEGSEADAIIASLQLASDGH